MSVSPEVFQHIRRIQFKMQKLVSDVFQGAYKSRFKGRGMEFEEVREYSPGDEMRTVDWNVTARMNTPYIKVFREERELTVMLLVDLSRSCAYGTGPKLKKEVMAEIGALLAFSAIRNNDKIGLILFSDRIELYVPPKKGVRHVLRLVREILVREPAGNGTDLKGALTFLGKVISRSCICFILSDFIIPQNYERELKITARRHDLIGLQVFDEKERDFPKIGLVRLSDLETGKIRLVDSSSDEVQASFRKETKKRVDYTKKLFGALGATLIEINDAEDYIRPLEKGLKEGQRK